MNWYQGKRCMGNYGPKKVQLEAMMAEAANIAKTWGWTANDVNIKRVMTHAEAASNKDIDRSHDNYGPVFWGGTGERSDLHKLSRMTEMVLVVINFVR